MTDANHFLAAIIAEPDDDLPRLVFADWLEENGDAERAEFIRLQCLLARSPLTPTERATVEARARELLAPRRPEWIIPGIPGRQEFRRGFVERLYIASVDFLANERHVERTAPVIDLRLSTAGDHLAALVDVPMMGRLRGLEFVNDELAGRLRTIFRPGLFPELRSLTLKNNRLWADDLTTLAQVADSWPKLLRLDLSGNPYSDDGCAALAVATGLQAVRELVLRSDGLRFIDCIHADGAVAIARSSSLNQLRLLNLAEHRVGNVGFMALIESQNAQHLERLDVSSNAIGEDGPRWATALTASPHLRRLKELNLARNVVERDAAVELAAWPHLESGCTIDFRGCEIGDDAREALLGSKYRPQFLLDEQESE